MTRERGITYGGRHGTRSRDAAGSARGWNSEACHLPRNNTLERKRYVVSLGEPLCASFRRGGLGSTSLLAARKDLLSLFSYRYV